MGSEVFLPVLNHIVPLVSLLLESVTAARAVG